MRFASVWVLENLVLVFWAKDGAKAPGIADYASRAGAGMIVLNWLPATCSKCTGKDEREIIA